MKSTELLSAIAAIVERRDDLVMSLSPLARVASSRAHERLVIIQAGLHGDERAGPITIARHLDRIADFVHAHGMELVVYPLANPRGFDAGTRYDGERPPNGNNDFLRYVRDDGSEVDEVHVGERFREWRWSTGGAQETQALRELLRREALENVVAALDLHQDCITPNVGAASYAYAFPPLDVYAPIAERCRELGAPPLANVKIDAGYASDVVADANGMLVRHDGSFSDLMHRLGAQHSIAVETTGATPLDVACAVNIAWIEGIVLRTSCLIEGRC